MTDIDLPDEVKAYYVMLKSMPDGRICGIHQLMYHWTMHVDIHLMGYEDRYCYATREMAEIALNSWDGMGDPILWHRHVNSGRRRNLQTGEEWVSD